MVGHQLTVRNFGPIRDAEVDINRFLLLIGPQSSGKSTIAKLIYYFLHVRDETISFVYDSVNSETGLRFPIDLQKILTRRFIEFWGTTTQDQEVYIKYVYKNDIYIEISLDKKDHQFVTIYLSPGLKQKIDELIKKIPPNDSKQNSESFFPSTSGKIAYEQERKILVEEIRITCNQIFNYEKNLFYIPAGRSLPSILAEQLQWIPPHLLDYPMKQFMETVNITKTVFTKSIDDLVVERRVLTSEKLDYPHIRKAQAYIKKILKGEYKYDKEGGKLFIEGKGFTKINFASSGQQEVVWILLSLFLLVLDRVQTLVFIEEPEAHLFSEAQKDIVEFIVFVFNTVECDFVITTHSPYLVSCLNNLLYSHELQNRIDKKSIDSIIPREIHLDPQNITGYFMLGGGIESLASEEEPHFLKCENLDLASEQINNDFENLLTLEREVARIER